MAKQIFVNLAVNDLDKSKAFFEQLGFTFNPQFTSAEGACMVIDENIFAMLLVKPFFQGFTTKKLADANESTEVIIALSAESREAVDEMVRKAVAAGGKEPRDAQDHGWMYNRAIEDLDGHIWEIAYMDLSAFPT